MIHAIAFPTSITFNYRTIVTVRRMINAFSFRVYSFLLAGMFNNVRHCELLAAHSFNLMNGSERSLIFHLERRSVLCRRRRRNENETGDTIVSYDFFVFRKNTGRWRLPLKKNSHFVFFFSIIFSPFDRRKLKISFRFVVSNFSIKLFSSKIVPKQFNPRERNRSWIP